MALQAIGLGFESPYLHIYHTREAFFRLRFETEFDSGKKRRLQVLSVETLGALLTTDL